ncbi:MAG: arpA protein [bacterium]|nr:arpA protein [bacterium]
MTHAPDPAARTFELADLVNLERFPIGEPASPGYLAAVEFARRGLRSVGCALLEGFVRPEAVHVLNQEVLERKGATHYSTEIINPYFHTTLNPDYPDRHVVNTFLERTSGFIPGDAWDPGCATDTLFRAPEVARLLADCLEIPELHCYDDPLAGLTTNVCDPGQQFTWHFDTNDFAVTVLVQPATHGGVFEYVPDIRSADDEAFEAISSVLDGDHTRVQSLDLRPGDLQIFRGRHSLHRVTRVGAGSCPRHAAIFAYTRQPGVIGRVARTRQLFGRVLPQHEQAEQQRVRSDALLD